MPKISVFTRCKIEFKCFIEDLSWVKIFFSPFKRPKIKFYFGKIKMGAPYFYPRKFVKSKTKKGYLEAKPIKWFGFSYCSLGWKTKWSDTDYRFEWSPILSFVFLKKQFCIFFTNPYPDSYWTSWLYYQNNTDKNKSKKDRVIKLINDFPQKYKVYKSNEETYTIDYYSSILKNKYLQLVKP